MDLGRSVDIDWGCPHPRSTPPLAYKTSGFYSWCGHVDLFSYAETNSKDYSLYIQVLHTGAGGPTMSTGPQLNSESAFSPLKTAS